MQEKGKQKMRNFYHPQQEYFCTPSIKSSGITSPVTNGSKPLLSRPLELQKMRIAEKERVRQIAGEMMGHRPAMLPGLIKRGITNNASPNGNDIGCRNNKLPQYQTVIVGSRTASTGDIQAPPKLNTDSREYLDTNIPQF